MSSAVPDGIETVRALRLWNVLVDQNEQIGLYAFHRLWAGQPQLHSAELMNQPRAAWPAGQALRAFCDGLSRSWPTNISSHHSPEPSCSCGIHGAKPEHPALLWPYIPWYSQIAWPVVCGTVRLWGSIIEGHFGFRAENAYPEEIWVPELTVKSSWSGKHYDAPAIADALSRRYQVRVEALSRAEVDARLHTEAVDYPQEVWTERVPIPDPSDERYKQWWKHSRQLLNERIEELRSQQGVFVEVSPWQGPFTRLVVSRGAPLPASFDCELLAVLGSVQRQTTKISTSKTLIAEEMLRPLLSPS